MVVYRRIEDVEPVSNTVLTIGSYDGLHRGHQEIITRVVKAARDARAICAVITFDPHPKQILGPAGDRFEVLMDIQMKLRLLQKAGMDIALVIPFDREFSRTTAREFLDTIVLPRFNPHEIIVGYDHHFGHNREGDGEFLKAYGARGSFHVDVVSGVREDDKILSSTHIRDLIREGQVRQASLELGWIYGFDANVIHGSGRGHSLTFPTANFVPVNPAQLLPKTGVYLSRGTVKGACHYGMSNIGFRPTFGENQFVMEIHLFDEAVEDFYGETIEVQFLERIRDEKKFDSPKQLVAQLRKDKEYCLSQLRIYEEEEPCL
ncbi:MAG: bifunctional riboflavin kinase/FAD synthetase [Fidelibacterota bacterium]